MSRVLRRYLAKSGSRSFPPIKNFQRSRSAILWSAAFLQRAATTECISRFPTRNISHGKPTSAQPTERSQPTTADTHAGKTYHEAEYEYIQHPAETERVKVVDCEAYSYEEPVYEQKWSMICWGCGADVGNDRMTNEERDEHMVQHILNGEPDGYHSGYTTVQTGTKTVNVPEESHYETRIVKEAWTEKKLIRAAGWY